MANKKIIQHRRVRNGAPYKFKVVSPRSGTVRIVDRKGADVVVIQKGSAIADYAPKSAADASLDAVGYFANALFAHASEDIEHGVVFAEAAGASLTAIDGVVEELTHSFSEGDLADPRAAAVQRTLGAMAGILTSTAFDTDLTAGQFDEQMQAAVETVRIFSYGDAKRLNALQKALDADDDLAGDDAEARAQVRLRALYQQVMRESLSTSQILAETGLSRQRVGQLRAENKLFGFKLPHNRAYFHPAWQFEPDNRLRDQLPQIITAAKEVHLGPVDLHLLMTRERDGQPTGVALLDDGKLEAVLKLVRSVDR